MSETVEDPETGTAAAPETPDYEGRARRMGWKPKDEYRGPPGGWRDAKEFVERGENELPVLKERLRKQDQDMGAVLKRLEESREVIADLAERTRKADERAYQRAKAELEAERDRAVEAGDTARFRALERRREELEAEKPKPAPVAQPAAQQADPVVTEWVSENPWFKNPALAAAADGIHRALLQSNPGLTIRQNLDTVTKRIRAAFPEQFPEERATQVEEPEENPRRRGAPDVTASSAPTVPSRAPAKSFRSLPQESKEAYAKFARQMKDGKPGWKPLTEQEWADMYYENEG